MAIEKGINDLRTIKGLIIDLKATIVAYKDYPTEGSLRRLGNLAGLLEERIKERRRDR